MGQRFKLFRIDEAVAPGDLFGAGNLQALAVLQRGNELAGFEQAVMRAGVQPGVAALHDLDIELAQIQIGLVDGGDFQFAPGAGFDGLGNFNDLVVVKIEARDGVVALGLGGLFLDAAGSAGLVKRHHAVALWVLHMVGKDGGAAGLRVGLSQQWCKVVAVKDVVAQHQGARMVSNELVANDERLRQAVGAGLHGVLQIHAPLAAVAQ